MVKWVFCRQAWQFVPQNDWMCFMNTSKTDNHPVVLRDFRIAIFFLEIETFMIIVWQFLNMSYFSLVNSILVIGDIFAHFWWAISDFSNLHPNKRVQSVKSILQYFVFSEKSFRYRQNKTFWMISFFSYSKNRTGR